MKLSQKELKMYEADGTAERMRQAIGNPDMAAAHPFYSEFKKRIQAMPANPGEAPISDNLAEALWKQLLQAYKVQGERVPVIRNDKKITTITAYLAAINDNDGFREWVCQVCALRRNAVKVPEGKELALWTGGYIVSKVAQDLGFCTLETTLLGAILNELPVTPDWDQEEALWNILSGEFVSQYQGTVHIYFRNVDEFCVLFQQEIPALKSKEKPVHVVWHPLENIQKLPDSAMMGAPLRYLREVGYIHAEKRELAINIDKQNHVFYCESNQIDKYVLPLEALADHILTGSFPANEYTLTHFRSVNFHPTAPAFAVDSNNFVGCFVNDFVQKFWGAGNV